MTPKERVLNALNHMEPDRVPAHINATKWVVAKLKKALNVKTDRELLKALHIDIYDMRGIDIHSGVVPDFTGPESEYFPSGWGGSITSFWHLKESDNLTSSGWTIDTELPPLAGASSVRELENYPWPDISWFRFDRIRKKLDDWIEFSVMATGASVFQHATFIRGTDTLMMDMMMNPEMADFLLDKVAGFYYEYYRRMFAEAGDLIDVFALADDFGMQNTLLISPELFDEHIASRLKKMVELAHSYGIRVLLHSCGNIEILIPRLIEIGVDILDPVQPESMDPFAIKEKYGSRICLRGGISVQDLLTSRSVQEVIDGTLKTIEIMKKGGGYILSPGHPVLQDDVPIENIIAMYETGYKYGVYN